MKQRGCSVYAATHGLPQPPDPEPRDLPDWLLEALNRQPSPDDIADYEARRAQREALTDVHPAVQLARRYLTAVREIAEADRASPTPDTVLSMAWESIGTLVWSISAKTARAIHEIIDRQLGDDSVDRTLDPRGVQSDGNGSAKVTRLMLRESREAWIAAAHADPRWARPAVEMVALLDSLDREIDAAFPFAMEFIRPGFDD